MRKYFLSRVFFLLLFFLEKTSVPLSLRRGRSRELKNAFLFLRVNVLQSITIDIIAECIIFVILLALRYLKSGIFCSLEFLDLRDPDFVKVPRVAVSDDDGQDGDQLAPLEILTIGVVPRDELEQLVEEDDWQRELHHGHPLLERQRGDLEHVLLVGRRGKLIKFSIARFSRKKNH